MKHIKTFNENSSPEVTREGTFICKGEFFFHGELYKPKTTFKITPSIVERTRPNDYVRLHSNEDPTWWVIYDVKDLKKKGKLKWNDGVTVKDSDGFEY